MTGTIATQSLSSASTSVPAGYYALTDLTTVDTDLNASNIKSGTNLFGVNGTFTSDANAVATDMLFGKSAYVNGVKVEGALTTSTPTQTSITGEADNNSFTQDTVTPAANGLFSSFTINLGVDFLKENICSGKTIFGRVGTAACNALFGGAIYSMAPRKDTATVTPSTSTVRNIATLSEEVSNATAFQDNHNLIPNPKFDTDGRYSQASGTAQRHYLVSITGRPNADCGSSGTLEERITNCGTLNGNKAFYDGKKYGQSGEGDWKLVTRITVSSVAYEVWRDERTKLLWSDRMTNTYNWYRASGYASTDSNTNNTGGYDARPGSGTGCSGAACQPNPPVSVCVDASLITTLSGYSAFTTPSTEDKAKGSLTYQTTPSITWRLPTIEDYKLADVNGIRKVLPNMDAGFWSASSLSNVVEVAWFFYGVNGGIYYYDRTDGVTSVRCVGR